MKSIYHAAILTDRGTPIQANITVYLADTVTKATIYSDIGGTIPKDNPFQTDILGRFGFYANQGIYDIEISGTGITSYKIEDILLEEKPWVDVREYASFSAVIDAIGSTETTLLIPIEQAISDDKIIPVNITLKFLQGGSLNIADTKTVTINGRVEAGLYQIFQWTGTGVVEFGDQYANVCEIYPEWWGAKGDGGTDDIIALNKALEAASGYNKRGNIVRCLGTTYIISDTLIKDADITLKGVGQKNRTVFRLKDGSNCDMVRNADFGGAGTREAIQIEDIEFDGNQANQIGTCHGLNFAGVNFLILKNVFVYDCKGDGIRACQGTTWAGTNNVNLDTVRSHSNAGSGFVFDGPPLKLSLREINAEGNGSYGIHIKDGQSDLYKRLANSITIFHPYIEDNVDNGIYLESGANVEIFSPFFWGGNNINPVASAIKIANDFRNVKISHPIFYGKVGESPPFYNDDINIAADVRGVILLGGVSPLRPSYAMEITDASGGAAILFRAGDNKISIGKLTPTSVLDVLGLPIYANNAAAIAGGLTAGALYRTNDDPDTVCVVH